MHSQPFELIGDNAATVEWLNGRWRAYISGYAAAIGALPYFMLQTEEQGVLHTRTRAADWSRHAFREHNQQADGQATMAIISGRSHWAGEAMVLDWGTVVALRGFYDGGRRQGMAASGWVLEAGTLYNSGLMLLHGRLRAWALHWSVVGSARIIIGERVSVAAAALFALCELVCALTQFAVNRGALICHPRSATVALPRHHPLCNAASALRLHTLD